MLNSNPVDAILVPGNEDTGLEKADLDKEFDPKKHDETMAQILGEDRPCVVNIITVL